MAKKIVKTRITFICCLILFCVVTCMIISNFISISTKEIEKNSLSKSLKESVEKIERENAENIFYQFNEGLKKYILIGKVVPSNVDMNASTINLTESSYKDGILYVDVKTEIKFMPSVINENMIMDYYGANVLYIVLEVPNKKYNGVRIRENGEGTFTKLNEYKTSKSSENYGNSTLVQTENYVVVEGPGGKRGLQNLNGKKVLECKYEYLYPIEKNKIIVSENNKTAIIDEKEKNITNWINGIIVIGKPEKDRFVIKTGEYYGIIDSNFSTIEECIFTEITSLANDKFYKISRIYNGAKVTGFLDENFEMYVTPVSVPDYSKEDIYYDGENIYFMDGINNTEKRIIERKIIK